MKLALLLLCSGCLSFEAVNATARLGDKVGAYQHALDPLGTWCRLSVAAGTQAEGECQKLDEDARLFARIPAQIAAWSEALRCMAEDKHARGFGAEVAALSAMAWPERAAGLGAAVDALTHLITSSYRRSALTHSVQSAAPHIALLVTTARATVKLQLERLETLEEQAGRIAQSLPEQTPSQVAERIALVDVRAWLHASHDQLVGYDQALTAFALAHARLAERPGSSDAAVYFAILSDLKGLYRGVGK